MDKDAEQQQLAGQNMSDEQQQQMKGARKKLGGIIKTDMPMRLKIMRILITIVLFPFVLLNELYKASKQYVIDFVFAVIEYDYIGLIIRCGTKTYKILCLIGQFLYKIVYLMNKIRNRNSGRIKRLFRAIIYYVEIGINKLVSGLQFIYQHTLKRVFHCLEYLWINYAKPICMTIYYGIIYISDMLDYTYKQIKKAFKYLWNEIIMYYMIMMYKQIVKAIASVIKAIGYVIQRLIGYCIIKPWRYFVRSMKYINQCVVQLLNRLYKLLTKVINIIIGYLVRTIQYLYRQCIKLAYYCGNEIKQFYIYMWGKFIIGCQHIYRAGISLIKLVYRIEKRMWNYTVQFWDYIYPKLIYLIKVLIVKPVCKTILLLVDTLLWLYDKSLIYGAILYNWIKLFYVNMIVAIKVSIRLTKQYVIKPLLYLIYFIVRKSIELVKTISYYFMQFLTWVSNKVIRPGLNYLLKFIVKLLVYMLVFLICLRKQAISVYKILRIIIKYLIIDTARFIKYVTLKLYNVIYTVFHFIYRCICWLCIKQYNLIIFMFKQSFRFYLFLDKTTRKIWSIIKLKLIIPAYYGLVSLKNLIMNNVVVPMVQLMKWVAGETVRIWHITKSIVVNWMITTLRIIQTSYIAIKNTIITIIQMIKNTITSVNEYVKVNILQPSIQLIKSQWHNVMESIIKPTKAIIIQIKDATVSAYQTQKEISLQHAIYMINLVKQISQSTKEYIIETKQFVGAQLTIIKEQITAFKVSMTEQVNETKLRINELSMQIKQQIIDIKNSILS